MRDGMPLRRFAHNLRREAILFYLNWPQPIEKSRIGKINARPCGRIFASRRFWDSRGELGIIHRTPTESEAGVNVDKDG